MSTESYPAVGIGGLNEDDWQKMFDTPDGIMQDFLGTGFGLTLNSGANTVTVAATAAVACVDGYYLKVLTAEAFSIPTTAGTYLIAVKYDPALNVEDPVDGVSANPLGPCRLIMTSSALTSPGGEKYLLLYKIVRSASQALSDAVLTDFRHWAGPTQYIVKMPAESLLDTETTVAGFGPFSLGTTIYQQSPPATFRRVIVSGTPKWQRSNKATALPTVSGLGAASSGAAPPQFYLDDSNCVHFEGTIGRSSGAVLSSGTDVVLGTLPVGARPFITIRWVCFGKPPSGRGFAGGDINPTTGVITLYGPESGSLTWLDLANIAPYRANV